jgi:hypothetical protein
MQRPAAVALFCIAAVGSVQAGDPPHASKKYLFVQANASAPAPIIHAGVDQIADQYIVAFRDDLLPEQIPNLAATLGAVHGFQPEKVWHDAVKAMFVRITEAQAQALASDPFVKYVEENARWHLSASQHTYVDPRACDPTTTTCTATVDDRLWHLDRLDQNYASPNDNYSYCTDGTGGLTPVS